MASLRIGDEVVADKELFPYLTETFLIVDMRYSITGRPMWQCRAVGEPRGVGMVFYSDELSHP